MNIIAKMITDVSTDVEQEISQELGEEISEKVVSVSEEDFYETTLKYIQDNEASFSIIKQEIQKFLEKVRQYEALPSKGYSSIAMSTTLLKLQKEFIYKDFFNIQNLINQFLGQTIAMTYVHIDEFGKREIRISENNIEHLAITIGQTWSKGSKYAKLSYVVQDNYEKLQNTLPKEDNEKLQAAAAEVESRYHKHRKKVLWEWVPSSWKGYRLNNMGPVNEAYVNMYVHNIKLTNPLEKDINDFMLDGSYGAIKADATRGFLIGDVAKNGVQYAVKGIFGSPQGTKEIISAFKAMEKDNFSEEGFAAFIKRFTYDELHRNYKPQIQELSKRSIAATLRYMKKN